MVKQYEMVRLDPNTNAFIHLVIMVTGRETEDFDTFIGAQMIEKIGATKNLFNDNCRGLRFIIMNDVVRPN